MRLATHSCRPLPQRVRHSPQVLIHQVDHELVLEKRSGRFGQQLCYESNQNSRECLCLALLVCAPWYAHTP